MKKESSMQKLFAYAGNYKYLTIASWILSAVSAAVLLYLADHAGSCTGGTGLQQSAESVRLGLAGGGICTVIHVHLYLRTAVFPHCGIPCTGQYAQHPDAAHSDTSDGLHGQ